MITVVLLAADDTVQICLAKCDPSNVPAWRSLLVGQHEADPLLYDKMEQRMTLQKMEVQVGCGPCLWSLDVCCCLFVYYSDLVYRIDSSIKSMYC
jgi:hypothetical protein